MRKHQYALGEHAGTSQTNYSAIMAFGCRIEQQSRGPTTSFDGLYTILGDTDRAVSNIRNYCYVLSCNACTYTVY